MGKRGDLYSPFCAIQKPVRKYLKEKSKRDNIPVEKIIFEQKEIKPSEENPST